MAIACGTLLLTSVQAVVWGWLLIHVGSKPGSYIAGLLSLFLFPLTFFDVKAKENWQVTFTRALGARRTHKVLGFALGAVFLLAGAISSIQVSGDHSAAGTELWLETRRQGADSQSERVEVRRIPDAEPLRRIGFAFRRAPVMYSGEYRLAKAQRLLPFVPRCYRYPDDFERRLVVTIVPDGALFLNLLRREYRLRVINKEGAIIADTKIGGRTGTYALSMDGHLPDGAFEARVRADQIGRDSTELLQHLAKWREYRVVTSPQRLRENEALRVDVLYLPSELLFSRSYMVTGPGQIIYLQ
jgi:hypothetical protein